MTKQETFKRRVRERMTKTGERYSAARRQLIEHSNGSGERPWVSAPEMSDDAIREATGTGWNEWCDIIEGWPGHTEGHTAIAAYIHAETDLDHWWSQCVTVGFERIVGWRLPHQRSDGTFSAGKSKTLTTDAALLRAALLDEDDRRDLFPGVETELRSKPTSKNVRLAVGPGVAEFEIVPRDDGRTKVTVAHEKLAQPTDVDEWKAYWAEWLAAIDEG